MKSLTEREVINKLELMYTYHLFLKLSTACHDSDVTKMSSFWVEIILTYWSQEKKEKFSALFKVQSAKMSITEQH